MSRLCIILNDDCDSRESDPVEQFAVAEDLRVIPFGKCHDTQRTPACKRRLPSMMIAAPTGTPAAINFSSDASEIPSRADI
jgi:hypothetical protein